MKSIKFGFLFINIQQGIPRKRFSLVLFLAFAFFMGGCSNNQNENPDAKSRLEKIHLNKGQTWKTNAETDRGIENMLSLINAQQNGETNDVRALQEGLNKAIVEIMKKCTMKEEGYKQLHNYLIPLKSKIDHLGKGHDRETIEAMENYLIKYRNYFE